MAGSYKFIKETTATTITEGITQAGDLYYTRYATGSSTTINAKYYAIVPTPNSTVTFFSGGGLYDNRTNYSGVKVAFYRYGTQNRCGFVFGTLKPTDATSSSYRPAIGYFLDNIYGGTTETDIFIPNTNSNYYDQKTGYMITYAVQWGLLWTQLADGVGVGAGIPILDLREFSQNEGLEFILSTHFNDGIWENVRDPYAGDGLQPTSGTGGGEGTFTDTNVPIDFPPLPTISVTDTGFVNLFNPTNTQLKALATYMWTNPLFDITNFKALFANPMDCIMSLAILPVNVPNGGTSTITVGNISTDVSMTRAAQQFIEFDCGTINIPEYWGCYLDYSPYTKLSIFLPFIGVHEISADEVMKKSIHLKYHIDIFTGGCNAFLKCGSSVLYTYSGQCAFAIPITGNDYTSIVGSIMGAVSSVGTTIATGGMAAPSMVGSLMSMATNCYATKPSINHGSGLAGNSGFLGIKTPYLILTRPNLCLPSGQNSFIGYPTYISIELSELTGYTEIENIHFNNFSGTDEEQSEVINLLKSGVIF